MKKTLLVLSFIIGTITLKSQAPQLLNYQGVARNASGNIITSSAIGLKFEILQGSTVVYSEEQSATTSAAGIFTASIGSGSNTSGNFSSINWANGPYDIRVSFDASGGTSFTTVGTSRLLSVPYSLYAEKAGSVNLNAGTGISISSGSIINTAPDQPVNISGTGVTGSYPNYTINTGSAYTGSTGISVTGSVITNTAPDQTITLTPAGISNITGTYPSYTIDVPAPSLNYNTSTSELTLTQGTVVSTATITTTSTSVSITGPNVTGTFPNYTITAVPVTSITSGNSNITVTGSAPNYTISSSPSLAVVGNSLSITDGNTVTLPAGTTYTNGAFISITSGSVIANTAPDQTVVIGNGINTTVNGTYPSFTIDATPSLSLAANVLSISGGNSVTLPAPTPLTPGTGISINSGTITNTAPDVPVNLVGAGSTTIGGTYPNFTIGTPPPPPIVISGQGTASVTTSGNNYTVTTPPVNMSYTPGTGILSYSPSAASNTINISPAVSVAGSTLTVGSSSAVIPGSNLWSRSSTTATTLFNANDFVGIGTTSPAQNFHVEGFNSMIRVQSTQSTTAANSMIEFGNTISNAFNAKGRIGNPGSGDHLEYDALTFHRFTNAGVERMRLTNAGELIIGNFVPFSQLDVSGKITMRSGAVSGYIPVSDGNGTMTWTNPNSVVPALWSVNGNSLYPTTSGNFIGLGTNNPTTKLHLNGSNASTFINAFSASPETAIRIANNDLTANNFSSLIFSTLSSGFASYETAKILGVNVNHTSGSAAGDLVFMTRDPSNINERMRLNSSGNLGIGTSSPASRLHVNGAVTITDGTQGANKVLTSDASGTGSWVGAPGVEFVAINQTFVDLSVSQNLGSLNITVPGPGYVVVTFDGFSASTQVGNDIILAASNTSANWGPNNGHVNAQNVGNSSCNISFSHTQTYQVSAAGTYTYFAVGQRWSGAGTSSIYGNLTARYFPYRY